MLYFYITAHLYTILCTHAEIKIYSQFLEVLFALTKLSFLCIRADISSDLALLEASVVIPALHGCA